MEAGFCEEFSLFMIQILFVNTNAKQKKVRKSLAFLNLFATHQRDNAFFFEFAAQKYGILENYAYLVQHERNLFRVGAPFVSASDLLRWSSYYFISSLSAAAKVWSLMMA